VESGEEEIGPVAKSKMPSHVEEQIIEVIGGGERRQPLEEEIAIHQPAMKPGGDIHNRA